MSDRDWRSLAGRMEDEAPPKPPRPDMWARFKAAYEEDERRARGLKRPSTAREVQEAEEARHKERGARSPLGSPAVKGWS
jgi:hypothetical protein